MDNNRLTEEFRKTISTPDEIAKAAIARGLAGRKGSEKYIKNNFSSLVEKLQIAAYRIYQAEEQVAWKKSIKAYVEAGLGKSTNLDGIVAFFQNRFKDFDSFFLSITQSRRSRAGSTFEDIIRSLFKKLNYPFAEQQVINGKPDFLMPNRAYYDVNPLECIVFTAKRTLRERWKQIVTEGIKARGFYLATIDEDVSENGLEQMMRNKIFLVVPLRLKNKIPHYTKAPNVITYEDFFEDYLDPAMKRWKKAGVI